MGLKWDAIDLDSGEIRVEAGRVSLDGGSRTATDDPKSKASKRVVAVEDLQPGTVPLLRALKARQAAERLAAGAAYTETGLVPVNAVGEPVRPELYSDRFRELCREAGLPVVRLHSIRDTLATKLEDLGVPPASAASLLGHTVSVYHAVYVQRTEKGARAAASALGAVSAGVS
jgi:integrase